MHLPDDREISPTITTVLTPKSLLDASDIAYLLGNPLSQPPARLLLLDVLEVFWSQKQNPIWLVTDSCMGMSSSMGYLRHALQ